MPEPTVPKYTRLPAEQAEFIERYAAEHHLTNAKAFALIVRRGIDDLIREESEQSERTK